ncbi:hypothetical protein VCHENC02_4893A, partial [Vibrio harveyi]
MTFDLKTVMPRDVV